jgi:hypothetical protein
MFPLWRLALRILDGRRSSELVEDYRPRIEVTVCCCPTILFVGGNMLHGATTDDDMHTSHKAHRAWRLSVPGKGRDGAKCGHVAVWMR